MRNCTSCGSPIPDGQGDSCSMCYGDIAHGSDGYYEDFLNQLNISAEELMCEHPDVIEAGFEQFKQEQQSNEELPF